ncbi:MAG: hypothetical protein ACRDYD_05020, partial [Acidimicrobiales bacterium]
PAPRAAEGPGSSGAVLELSGGPASLRAGLGELSARADRSLAEVVVSGWREPSGPADTVALVRLAIDKLAGGGRLVVRGRSPRTAAVRAAAMAGSPLVLGLVDPSYLAWLARSVGFSDVELGWEPQGPGSQAPGSQADEGPGGDLLHGPSAYSVLATRP